MGFAVSKFYINKVLPTYDKTLSHLVFLSRYDTIGFVYLDTNMPVRYTCLNNDYNTLLICHNGNCDIGQIDIESIAHHYQVNVCTFDYCGYGLHSQHYLDEEDMYTDVKCVYEYLVSKMNVNPRKIIIYGHGLGSAPACYLASKLNELYLKKEKLYTVDAHIPKAVILVSPILSGMKSLISCSISSCDLFRNDLLASQIFTPTMIIHEERNNISSYSSSFKLASLFPNLYGLFTVEDESNYGLNFSSEFSQMLQTFLLTL
jgi:hypothetical protein